MDVQGLQACRTSDRDRQTACQTGKPQSKEKSRVITAAEKLNVVLIVALFLVFTSGYVLGAINVKEPAPSPFPANYNPALADANASLRACNEVLAAQTKACSGASH